jgi:aspartyl-tRNA(Asn)/glutamyl-tRNA(Gln) amidotransferase subunit A
MLNALESKPLDGLRIGLIAETVGDGVDPSVSSAISSAANHLQSLGAKITEVIYTFTLFISSPR